MAARALVVAILLGAGCRVVVDPAVPGDVPIAITAVTIAPRAGEQLTVETKPLLAGLGLRAKSLLGTERGYNEFRIAEDRRRIAAFYQEHGRFDVEVDAPRMTFAPDRKRAAVTWPVHEGVAYRIASVDVVGAPADELAELRAKIPFGPGDELDLEIDRPLRVELADHLQAHGYGHARGYSRTFVDRARHTIAWFYYLDPGPRTRIGALTVEGNARVPAAQIVARAGLAVGQPFSTAAARAAELALMDTGAFASAAVVSDADIQRLPEYPDSGGVLAPAQVGADGALVPRVLPEALAIRIVVVEAPARQLRVEAGVEGDPDRVDAFAGARVLLRDLFGPQQHLVLAGTAGYGWLVGDRTLAGGFYGSALAQYQHPGWLTRALDLRLTARWRDELYPAAVLRELVAGPGVRAVLAPGVFLDFDAWLRFARQLDAPALDPGSTGGLALPTGADATGAELVGQLIADRRDDRVEPTRGWLLGLGASLSPGGPLGDHRWLQLTPDARLIVPLGRAGSPWSLALRGSGGVVLAAGDAGVPLGARLFGGGPYGMRGFGRDQLSPAACAAGTSGAACDRVLVGGRSLLEASAELRMLPFRKQTGAVTFVDAGGAGAGLDPLAAGVSIAYGLGARLRIWYLPIALDVAYRVVDDNHVGLALGRVLAFVRVGEAF